MATKGTRKTGKRTTTGRGRGGSGGGGGGQQIGLLLTNDQKKDLRTHIANSEKLMKLIPEWQTGHKNFLVLAAQFGIEPRTGRTTRTRRASTTARTGRGRSQQQAMTASA